MARPTPNNPDGAQISPKFTDEVISKLEQAFSLDSTVIEACYYADISTDTYYRWIKDHPELSDKFNRLRQKPILKARQEWINKFGEDWKACESYLKRKLKNEFSERFENFNAEVSAKDLMKEFEDPDEKLEEGDNEQTQTAN